MNDHGLGLNVGIGSGNIGSVTTGPSPIAPEIIDLKKRRADMKAAKMAEESAKAKSDARDAQNDLEAMFEEEERALIFDENIDTNNAIEIGIPTNGNTLIAEKEDDMSDVDATAIESSVGPADDSTGTFVDFSEVKPGEEFTIVRKAKTRGFNATAVQNALDDSEDEGGVAPYGSSAQFRDNDAGGIYNPKEQAEVDGVNLTGFSVRYTKAGVDHTVSVNNEFETIEDAKSTINGDKYFIVVDGKIVPSTIVVGTPIIQDNERQICSYVDGRWNR